MAKKQKSLFSSPQFFGTSAIFDSSALYLRKGNAKIEKVIFNNPATIIIWDDKTKTVVKCQDEPFDAERGMAMAIAKKYFGNKGNYNNEFKKWVKCYNKE